MASPNIWHNGLTGSSADPVIASGCSYLSGSVIWLDSVNGADANAGTERELPKKTFAAAYAVAAAGSVIVIEAGSAFSWGVAQALALSDLTVLGLGSGVTSPRFTCTAAVDLFQVGAAGVKFQNLYFSASTAAATSRVNVAVAGAEFEARDCYFECGASDTGAAILVSGAAGSGRVDGCTFIATAARPAIGLSIAAAADDWKVVNTVFDGGSFGWTDYAFKVSAAATGIRAEHVTMVNHSDLGFTVAGTSYKLFDVNCTGRVVIAA